jgi:alpha-glucosidase
MPWLADAPAAGFSTGKPWLPADAAHRPLSVDRQQQDAGSMLHWTRQVLALRRAHPALRLGSFETLHADADVLVLRRVHGSDAVLAAFNLGRDTVQHELAAAPRPSGPALTLGGAALQGVRLHLPPSAVFIRPL